MSEVFFVNEWLSKVKPKIFSPLLLLEVTNHNTLEARKMADQEDQNGKVKMNEKCKSLFSKIVFRNEVDLEWVLEKELQTVRDYPILFKLWGPNVIPRNLSFKFLNIWVRILDVLVEKMIKAWVRKLAVNAGELLEKEVDQDADEDNPC
uniref:DUF4283 domain-containing protein n=1 Tax=Nelumbo nucifera TaxID=4432 RepID=A0A822XRU4_NELNU|nr:TPA_asm: hypothetical protein HUJ06_025788 [Nelumbo nucifera]